MRPPSPGSGHRGDRSTRLYAWLLCAYSPRFRRMYGEGMVTAFRLRRAEAERGGRLKLAAWALLAVADILWNAPQERLSTWRDARRGDSAIAGFGGNIRFALRQLARQPALSITLIVTLGLGTGATAAFFGVVDAALLRPLPYPEADRLVLLTRIDPAFGAVPFAPPFLADLRERVTTVESLVGFSSSWEMTLTGLGEPRLVVGAYVSDGVFPLLGAEPTAGRAFEPAEHTAGGPASVVVSEGFWSRHFGAEAPLRGQTMTLDGTPYTVVGILPELPLPITSSLVSDNDRAAELWLPFARNDYFELRSIPVMNVIGRLPEGSSLERATEELNGIGEGLAAATGSGPEGLALSVDPLADVVASGARRTVLTLFGAAAFLLLIACANVANLLLARATARQRELAVRHSLGAGRAQLIGQLLTESLVVALIGGALGLGLAWMSIAFLGAADLPGMPPSAELRVDSRLGAFAAAAALATAFLFGLVPAMHATSAASGRALRPGVRATVGGGGVRRTLVSLQVGLAVTLLVGAGLLARSFVNLIGVDPGFRAEGLLQVPVPLAGERYAEPGPRLALVEQTLAELGSLPGVTGAAAVNRLPLGGGNVLVGVEVEGYPTVDGQAPLLDRRVATPGYFEVMGIPILEGRGFGASDAAASAPPVAVVNEAFGRRLPDGGRTIGRRLRLMLRSGPGPWLTIVGVSADVRHHGLDRPGGPEIYVPYAQAPVEAMTLVARTVGDPADLTAGARDAIWRLDPDLPLDGAGPVRELVEGAVQGPRFRAFVLNGFAALALLLAAVGIYGVISYTVALRTRETGVRLALGADRTGVVREIVGRGLASTGWGLLLGLGGGILLSRTLTKFLFGVEPLDAATFGGVGGLILVVALVASYLPARRAARVDPVRALAAD